MAQRGALSTLPSCHTVTNTKGHLIALRAPLREAERGFKGQRRSVNAGSEQNGTEILTLHFVHVSCGQNRGSAGPHGERQH